MTVCVTKTTNTVADGIAFMFEAMIADYADFMPPKDEIRTKMYNEFKETLDYIVGKKYIKVVEKRGDVVMRVVAFIVYCDDDKKFMKGDILKPAGWAAPARNKARGNVLDGNYSINWTGPLYL